MQKASTARSSTGGPPFLGPPAGWKVVEGKLKTRHGDRRLFVYDRLDGKYKGRSLKEVFQIEATENGEGFEAGIERFAAFRERENETFEAAIAHFREAHGSAYSFACYLPGWSVRLHQVTYQTRTYYTSPLGATYNRLLDVEAQLGKQMQEGTDISAFIGAAKRAAKEARAMKRKNSGNADQAEGSAEVEPANEATKTNEARAEPAVSKRQREAATRKAMLRQNRPSVASIHRERLQRWRRFTYSHRRRSLLYLAPDADPRGADARLARRLAARSRYAAPGASIEVPLHSGIQPGSGEERWVLGHPLWIKIARRGYPIPISEREILALRSYTPREYGGTADLRYF